MSGPRPSLLDLMQRVESGDRAEDTCLELVDAARTFTSALLLSPGPAGEEKGRWLWDTLAGLFDGRPPPLVLSSQALFLAKVRRKSLAMQTLLRCLELHPKHFPALESLESLRDGIIDRWHFHMLNDQTRNSAYQAAIAYALHLRPGAVVLDIGGVSP